MQERENAIRNYNNDLTIAKEEGIEEGRREGMEKGENKKAIEIATKMLDKGMNINDISELSGLSVEEIEGLGKKQQDNH